jgi:hypothetical protein
VSCSNGGQRRVLERRMGSLPAVLDILCVGGPWWARRTRSRGHEGSGAGRLHRISAVMLSWELSRGRLRCQSWLWSWATTPLRG